MHQNHLNEALLVRQALLVGEVLAARQATLRLVHQNHLNEALAARQAI
ncbi:MAG: hypothetical protein Q4G67_15145 [Actinomycetia bacterium]|nr:hypothetical protein [Actinomycetes bacterium]